MNVLAIRNCKLYFRNKRGVLSSLISALIVILLYVFFLGDNMKQSLSIDNFKELDYLINSWVMAGFIAVASSTTILGASGLMIRDRENGNIRDFLSSPLKPFQLTSGYVLSIYVIGVIMSLFTFIVAEIYIVLTGGNLLSLTSTIEVFLIILLSVLASSSIMFFLVSLFDKIETFQTATSIIAPLTGFLTGIYIPIGALPSFAQTIVKIFPLSHSAVLLRQVMMKDVMEKSFVNVPDNLVLDFKHELGVTFQFGNTDCRWWIHVLVLLGTAIIFYGLATIMLTRKRK